MPAIMLIAAELLAYMAYGFVDGSGPQALRFAVFSWGMLIACLGGGAASWWLFTRLEVIEGRGQDLSLPSWPFTRARDVGAPGASSKRHPSWMLLSKELRLQQMSFVLAGAFVVFWVLVATLRRALPELEGVPLRPLSLLYMPLLSIVIGGLAAAEERQFGTHQWHLLLPMAAWKQWLLKAGVVVALSLLLGVGLTAALSVIGGAGPDQPMLAITWLSLAGLVVMLSVTSLYVSSLSTSGVRAAVLSMPFIAGTGVWIQLVASSVALMLEGVGRAPSVGRTAATSPLLIWLWVLLCCVCLAVYLLRLGYVNYRTLDHRTSVVAIQVVSIVALVTAGVVMLVLMVNR